MPRRGLRRASPRERHGARRPSCRPTRRWASREVGAPAELEELPGLREGSVQRRVVVAHDRQLRLDGLAADPVDEQVGGGVVADLDHLRRRIPNRHQGAARQVLQLARRKAAGVVGDDQGVVPRQGARRHGVGHGPENVELEDRTERLGRVARDVDDALAEPAASAAVHGIASTRVTVMLVSASKRGDVLLELLPRGRGRAMAAAAGTADR